MAPEPWTDKTNATKEANERIGKLRSRTHELIKLKCTRTQLRHETDNIQSLRTVDTIKADYVSSQTSRVRYKIPNLHCRTTKKNKPEF